LRRPRLPGSSLARSAAHRTQRAPRLSLGSSRSHETGGTTALAGPAGAQRAGTLAGRLRKPRHQAAVPTKRGDEGGGCGLGRRRLSQAWVDWLILAPRKLGCHVITLSERDKKTRTCGKRHVLGRTNLLFLSLRLVHVSSCNALMPR